ncbi:MAG: hypothetical protein Q8Q07_02240 [Dehalococcoidales bacterium]|nr:hypothetical protein [Dehalococcoidales bacterium]
MTERNEKLRNLSAHSQQQAEYESEPKPVPETREPRTIDSNHPGDEEQPEMSNFVKPESVNGWYPGVTKRGQ